jgi:hypothetical protein
MNIKVKDHRSFGRKPIVGFHVIKSLEQFRCDPTAPSLTIMQAARKILSINLILKNSFIYTSEAPVAPAPVEEVPPASTDKKSKKHKKDKKAAETSLADGTVATTTIALTTNETETTIVDKKTMKKRVKHFLKRKGTPMKPESKLAKIQKSMMGKHIPQYQSVPVIEEVCHLQFSRVKN